MRRWLALVLLLSSLACGHGIERPFVPHLRDPEAVVTRSPTEDAPFRKAPPPPLGDESFPKVTFASFTLENGLRVVLVERRSFPVVAANLRIDMASADADGTGSAPCDLEPGYLPLLVHAGAVDAGARSIASIESRTETASCAARAFPAGAIEADRTTWTVVVPVEAKRYFTIGGADESNATSPTPTMVARQSATRQRGLRPARIPCASHAMASTTVHFATSTRTIEPPASPTMDSDQAANALISGSSCQGVACDRRGRQAV